ncbi:tRNA (adenosine(37)-N6)-threonylcarbamoyltransferase complex ATPase subunit type 1 TsaE [Candidatus Nomurabacteria bacterium]|nr:tRNA (adenosine(37)-N6)-threonylcarbamoyltransferase complex ATPase subunit type 1 TsaE [Candidatus Kaiserbacteria bacterium]MCB9815430.1 tRNA (adenosine(37)-N6)-threonylcarbamoyltransferase complex ATPase subunit type 1 TsaE [Candidatus Nomurabacteria bacterium]
MKNSYLVSTPIDFKIVIDCVLSTCKESAKESLVIALTGDLGAGKTTFTQELGRRLGVLEQITSPTFTIMKQYDISYDGFEKLIHIDAYRIESVDETKPLHLDSLFSQPKTIVCVEWPERIHAILPSGAVNISITIKEGETRQVEVS